MLIYNMQINAYVFQQVIEENTNIMNECTFKIITTL